MKKQTGIVSTLFVLCAAALFWTGCSTQHEQDYRCGEARYESGCKTLEGAKKPSERSATCNPECASSESAHQTSSGKPIVNKNGHNLSHVENCGVRVSAKQPQLCMQGDSYFLDIEVQAQRDVCEVAINAMLPEGVSLVKSEPEGIVSDGKQIKWFIEGMQKGEKKCTRVTLRADREGQMCVCFCVTAVPVQFCSVVCARPVLVCEKCGPVEVAPGDPVNFTITVTNTGSCAAEDVVVTENVPPQLKHASGEKTLTFNLGTIEAGASKKINVCFTACERGKACNIATVTACNAAQTSSQFCTYVLSSMCNVTKTGPKEVPMGGTATYEIVVTNPGDKVLTDVVVSDCSPQATSTVEAKGAIVSGNQAVWKLKELNPGDKQVFQITQTSCTPGYFVNRVNVVSAQGCPCHAEAGTRWLGAAALNVQMVSLENPICVGDPTSYTIRVMNQGNEEDKNVTVIVRFPPEVRPTAANGPVSHDLSGQVVAFSPIQALGPRQSVEFRADAIGVSPGDARVKVEVVSDSIKTPIVQQESTIVR